MTINLTEAYLKRLAVDMQPGEYQDETEKSLRVYVGVKRITFGFYKWSPATGRPVRKSLGSWPTNNVEDVRKKAKLLAATLEGGGTIEEKPPAGTIRDVVLAYTAYRKIKGDKDWNQMETVIERSFHDWLPRPMSAITKSMLAIRHDKIAESRGATQPPGRSRLCAPCSPLLIVAGCTRAPTSPRRWRSWTPLRGSVCWPPRN